MDNKVLSFKISWTEKFYTRPGAGDRGERYYINTKSPVLPCIIMTAFCCNTAKEEKRIVRNKSADMLLSVLGAFNMIRSGITGVIKQSWKNRKNHR